MTTRTENVAAARAAASLSSFAADMRASGPPPWAACAAATARHPARRRDAVDALRTLARSQPPSSDAYRWTSTQIAWLIRAGYNATAEMTQRWADAWDEMGAS